MSEIILPGQAPATPVRSWEVTVKRKLYQIAQAITNNELEKAHLIVDDLFTTGMSMIVRGEVRGADIRRMAGICLRAHSFNLKRGYTPGG